MPITGAPTHVIADVALTAPATFLEVTNLDINRDGPYTIYAMLHSVSGANQKVWTYINGDLVNANYYVERVYFAGAAATIRNWNEPYTSFCAANGTPITTMDLYRDIDGHPRWTAQTCYHSGVNLRLLHVAGRKTAPVANITALRFTIGVANGFGAGTRLIISRLGH